jgi:hypothetical protein
MKKFRKLTKINSIKAYNDSRKQILLGKDDFGKKLYPWDFVEVSCRMEMRTTWMSQIYWNPLDGAYIDAHPGHIAMNCGEWRSREFGSFLRDKSDISHLFYPELEKPTLAHTIKKVTYQQFLDWKKSQEGKHDSVRDANIKIRDEARKRFEEEAKQYEQENQEND